MFRRLLVGWTDPPASRRPLRPTPKRSNGSMADQLARANRMKPLVAGQFEIVDLSDVRTAMGAAWQDVAGTALRLMGEELESGLAEGDTYQAVGECTFIVSFVDQDRERSTFRANAIADRIRGRLAVELPKVADRLGVGRFVAEVPQDSVLASELPVAQALLSSLQAIRAEAREADRLANTALINDTRVLFQPCWQRASSSIAFNRVVLDPIIGRSILQRIKGVGDPAGSQRVLAELDYAVFTKAIMVLHSMANRGTHPAPLIVPVQQSTLAGESSRQAYLALIKTLPDAYRPLVVVEVLTSPRPSGGVELTEVMKAIHKKVRRVVLRISPGQERLMWLAGNIWGVSVDLTEQFVSSPPLPVMPLLRAARTLDVSVLVLGANTLSAMTQAESAGFDYLAGGAVHLTTDVPKPAHRYNPFVGLGDISNPLEAQARRMMQAMGDVKEA